MPQASGPLVLSVSDFVGLLNQTLEFAYPNVSIVGELVNFRVSKNRWVYFDLKDELASVKFFGTVYNLPGPLEDGLMLQVSGNPRLHPLYGFSVTVQSIQPVGEGSLKRASALLEAKLRAEGLFAPDRKRVLPYPPNRIGLITSSQAAAYHDFIKVLDGRWGGVEIQLADVQVQGEPAPGQLVAAIEHFNQQAQPPEVLIITRGGGSSEDLAAFNTEPLARAIASSRIPTLVAIGHEVDISLAELAADVRASTPSNAAEILVPDRRSELVHLANMQQSLGQYLTSLVIDEQVALKQYSSQLSQNITQYLNSQNQYIQSKTNLLTALNPVAVLKRGYAIVRSSGKVIRSGKQLQKGNTLVIQLADAKATARVNDIQLQ
ncbi:MAG TPA: exodeoxyribonuclease VII large subunit [Patescibacteria group bacterium]|nr:exodeoxyribonuclease VII large subunit [Patescibacteria group bacterium]